MIRLQIVERPGSNLFRVLKKAMRTGDLRTFSLERRGWKVVHEKYPGWMNWSYGAGVISCEILSPKKEGAEWQILSALIGRLAQRYAGSVDSINIQLGAQERNRVRN
jgi:hypothetical protein